MKTIFTTLALSLALTATALGADFVNITKVTANPNNTTTVQAQRTYTDASGRENVISVFGFTFKNTLSVQNAVDKVALLADGNITVKSTLASTTPKQGQIGVLAEARYKAWLKGLAAYFTELNAQIANEGLAN